MQTWHYHLLHLLGLLLTFIGIGALLVPSSNFKIAMRWHGIGLFILLVSGFGNLAVMGRGLPEGSPSMYTQPWVIAKLVIFLLLGALPILAKRRVLAPTPIVIIGVLLGLAAGYFGYLKRVG